MTDPAHGLFVLLGLIGVAGVVCLAIVVALFWGAD